MSNTRPRFHYPRERNSGDRRVITALCGAHLNDLYRIAVEDVDCCECHAKLRRCAIDSARRKGMNALANRILMGYNVEAMLRRAAKAVGWKQNVDGERVQ